MSDEDVEIIGVQEKGKRKAGERLEWSSDDVDDNAYATFKNRKATKRKKQAASNKRPKTLPAGAQYELDEELPEYFCERRKRFDSLTEADLRLPPNYDDIEFSDNERLDELAERPNFSIAVEPSRPYRDIELPHSAGVIPASIAQYLRDYQVAGVEFLHELFVYQRGGILGDDMGLGKTVQVAAFLTVAFGKSGDERDAKRMRKMRRSEAPWYPRILIICPATLMSNWVTELTRWGWWHVEICHGARSHQDDVLQAATSGRLEVVITTYKTYCNHRSKFNLIAWDAVVADEMHVMKERLSEVTLAMLEVNALCRIGLTGTAIQNKYEELWTLLNWTNPGRFGTMMTWKSSISTPLRLGQSFDATLHQLKQSRAVAKKLVENLLPRFFLRRMKSLIAHQLPKKIDKVVFCPLTEVQREAYELFLDSEMVAAVRDSSEPCPCESGLTRGRCCYEQLAESNTTWQERTHSCCFESYLSDLFVQALVFPVISTLQKLANHLALLIPNSADPKEKQVRDLDMLQKMVPLRWGELYKNRDSLFNLCNPDFCGKWRILKKLLKFWHGNGDKVLIFSHSVRLLKMLQHLFNNTSYNVSFLDGSMAHEDRQRTVDDFNSDPGQFVFLISTKAGGVGLNITSANKVVIFDPNWNPSYDLQAQDRAYRIGQLRDVEVFRLVSAGTVEEIVYARQIYKQQQANIGYNASTERRYFKGVQASITQKGELFGLQNLLSFHGDGLVLRNIINKTNIAEAKYGVEMVGVDMEEAINDEDNPLRVDDDDKGDGAMSQLAALLTESEAPKMSTVHKPRPKTDAVQAILASAGVEYTHENSEVVATSKVEELISRHAEELGGELGHGEQRLFAERRTVDPGSFNYKFHPPEHVMVRQFCTMARTFGFENATEFALVVEGMTQKERTQVLERFYNERRKILDRDVPEVNGTENGGVADDVKLENLDEADEETADEYGGDGKSGKDAPQAMAGPIVQGPENHGNGDDVSTEDDEL